MGGHAGRAGHRPDAFQTAVAEVAANIVEHAARGEAVALRLVLRAPTTGSRPSSRTSGSRTRRAAVAAGDDDDPLAESGRGLFMARALTDELDLRARRRGQPLVPPAPPPRLRAPSPVPERHKELPMTDLNYVSFDADFPLDRTEDDVSPGRELADAIRRGL